MLENDDGDKALLRERNENSRLAAIYAQSLRATAGNRRRRARKRPRSVKRGHYPQRSLQEV